MSVRYREDLFPPSNLDWETLAPNLAVSSDLLARYDSFLGIIPSPGILIAPLMMREAVLSSRIEGTRATVGDVLEYNAGNVDVTPEKRDDIQEIINYQQALIRAKELLSDLPLCGRVIREAHGILLSGVRGELKSPGKYRTDQNWIGTYDSTIETARYVPVEPSRVEECMFRWERFVNDNASLPSLIKIAVAHAEFESIHPFDDGNGRVGRILIPLMMLDCGLISSPCFFLSAFFDMNNVEYGDRLLAVTSDGDWSGWCGFFLRAVSDQARQNLERAKGMYDLRESIESELAARSGSIHSSAIVDKLFSSAIFRTAEFIKIPGVGPQTARTLLRILQNDMGVIKVIEEGRGRRSSLLAFPELLKLME